MRYETVRHVPFILQLPSVSHSDAFFSAVLSRTYSFYTSSHSSTWMRYEVNFKWVLDKWMHDGS